MAGEYDLGLPEHIPYGLKEVLHHSGVNAGFDLFDAEAPNASYVGHHRPCHKPDDPLGTV